MPLTLSPDSVTRVSGHTEAVCPESRPPSCWDRLQQPRACFPYTQGPDTPGISLVWVPNPLLVEIRKA